MNTRINKVMFVILGSLMIFTNIVFAENSNSIDEDAKREMEEGLKEAQREMAQAQEELKKMQQELATSKDMQGHAALGLEIAQTVMKNVQGAMGSQFGLSGMKMKQQFESIKQDFSGKEIASETIEKTFKVKKEVVLNLDCQFSSIEIESWKNKSEVFIQVVKKVGAETKKEADKLLNEVEVKFENEEKEVSVEINIPGENDRQNTVMYNSVKVKVPKGISIDSKNTFGDVVITNVEGNIDCETSFGSLCVKDSEGELNINTEFSPTNIANHKGKGDFECGGNLTIDGWEGNLDVSISMGEINICNVIGDIACEGSLGSANISDSKGKLDMESGFGTLNIKNHEGDGDIEFSNGELEINEWIGNMDIECSYGEVTIKRISKSTEIDIEVAFGKLDMEMPEDFNGEVDIETSFGSINVPKNFKKEKDMFCEEASCKFGEGDGKIDIETSYSEVNISLEKN